MIDLSKCCFMQFVSPFCCSSTGYQVPWFYIKPTKNQNKKRIGKNPFDSWAESLDDESAFQLENRKTQQPRRKNHSKEQTHIQNKEQIEGSWVHTSKIRGVGFLFSVSFEARASMEKQSEVWRLQIKEDEEERGRGKGYI